MSDVKRFGLWTLTFLVVANMVGAGVFTTSGYTLQSLGSPSLVVTAWVVAGVIALAGAASYGNLVRAMPESGGEYVFLSRAVHPLLGFIAGWVSLIAGFTGAIAYAATAFESYVTPTSVRPGWLPQGAVAVGVVVASGLFHAFRPHVGAFFQNATVLLKLGFLLLFLTLAASRLTSGSWHGEPLEGTTAMSGWSTIIAFASSLIWISLSYSGFNAAVYVAEEAKDVTRTIPAALVLGTFTVTVLYVLLNAVFVFGPPAADIAMQPDVAAVAAQWLGGPQLATLVRAIIALALLTSVSSMMMAAPRVYAKMADDGLMPGNLRFHGGAPRSSTIVQIILAVSLIVISSLQGEAVNNLLRYLSLTLSLSAACSVSCLLLPSVRTRPMLHLNSLPPIVFIVGTLIPATLMTWDEPRQLLATALTFAVGAVAYACRRLAGRSLSLLTASTASFVNKLTRLQPRRPKD